MCCVARSRPLAELYTGFDWLIKADLLDNEFNRLSMIYSEVPVLRAQLDRVLAERRIPGKEVKVLQLLVEAEALDSRLEKWQGSLPDVWRSGSVASLSGLNEDPEVAEVWPGLIHVYDNLFIASVVNNYRSIRIFAHSIIVRCLDWLAAANKLGAESADYDQSFYILQKMTDDICSSVPYHLGYRLSEKTSSSRASQEKAAGAIGGYLLIYPLFVASCIDCVPEKQNKWIRGRMRALALNYGLNQAAQLSRWQTSNPARNHVSPFAKGLDLGTCGNNIISMTIRP